MLVWAIALSSLAGVRHLNGEERQCQFDISVNGVAIHYDLSPLLAYKGKCKPVYFGTVNIARGKFISPFVTTTDRPINLLIDEVGPVMFTSTIEAFKENELTLEDLPKHFGRSSVNSPAGKRYKATKIQIKTIGSRRWSIMTRFEDNNERIEYDRTFSTIQDGLTINFYTEFASHAPKDADWRTKRLALQEQLVRLLRIGPSQ